MKTSVFIYPNPGNGHLNVSIKNSKYKITSVEIYDVMGKIVYELKKNNLQSDMWIDISNQSDGVYFIKINTEKQIFNSKIILAK